MNKTYLLIGGSYGIGSDIIDQLPRRILWLIGGEVALGIAMFYFDFPVSTSLASVPSKQKTKALADFKLSHGLQLDVKWQIIDKGAITYVKITWRDHKYLKRFFFCLVMLVTIFPNLYVFGNFG